MHATAIGRMNARVIAYVYAMSTPGRSLDEMTFRRFVAPAFRTSVGSTPGASFGMVVSSLLENTFWATEMEIAPPRVLKKITNASVGVV